VEVHIMHTYLSRALRWAPRVLAIAFAAFLAIFAVDVFQEGHSLRETIVALLMHLMPMGVVLVVLVIAWRWRALGGLLFLGLGTAYIAAAHGRFDWTALALIGGPPVLIGALFLMDRPSQRKGVA
jgi:hypothetical protein